MQNLKGAFNAYVFYVALKKHFTSDYDFLKYQGKVKASMYSFEKRNDKYLFYKLSKKKHYKELVLANMVRSPNIWVGDLLDEHAEAVYLQWQKRQDSLTYQFKQDLKKLDENFDANLAVINGQHPPLLNLYIQEEISLETLVIINELTQCFLRWAKKITDKIVFPVINNTVNNYTPFLALSETQLKVFRQCIIDEFTHNAKQS